jgi:uncharacterized protein YbaP (TraB family)
MGTPPRSEAPPGAPPAPGRRAWLRAALAAPALAAGCAWTRIPGMRYAPPMLELSREGAPGRVLLLGTVHAGLPRFYPLPPQVERAFAEARSLLVEIDTEVQADAIRAAGVELGVLPPGETLASVLQPSTLRALRDAYRDRPWELHAMRRLRPWALTLQLPDLDDERMGAESRDGLERHLIARARARPIPVVELERADAQVRAFAGGTHDEQDAALALRLALREAHARSFGRIVDAWRVGDLDRLAELKDLAFPPEGRLAPLRRRLFAERDEGLADGLAAALDAPRASMALVGVLHLAGPDALQHALARRGVSATVQRDA